MRLRGKTRAGEANASALVGIAWEGNIVQYEHKGPQQRQPVIRPAQENEQANPAPDSGEDDKEDGVHQSGISTPRQRRIKVTFRDIYTRSLEELIIHWKTDHKESQTGDNQRQPNDTSNKGAGARQARIRGMGINRSVCATFLFFVIGSCIFPFLRREVKTQQFRESFCHPQPYHSISPSHNRYRSVTNCQTTKTVRSGFIFSAPVSRSFSTLCANYTQE